MNYLEVKITVAADNIFLVIENQTNSSSHKTQQGYDLSKLYLEIRVSKIFQKVLNIRSAMVKTPIEIFDQEDFVTLGEMLNKLLFEQHALKESFSEWFKYVNDSSAIRCRIFLEFDKNVSQMAELPWEYIRFEEKYLAANERANFDLIRKISLGEDLDKRAFPLPDVLNVILIIADTETPDRALPNSEKQDLRDMFSTLKKNNPGKFNYAIVSSPSRKSLIEKIRDARTELQITDQPYVIHFYGHAKPDGVALSPGRDNATQADWISDTYFANLFNEMIPAEKPVVFIFTACDSGKITKFAENRGVALQMLCQHKLYGVLAMQNEVVSSVAIAFMKEVYQCVLKGADLAEAISKGRTYLGNKYDYGEQSGDRGSYSNNAFGSPVLFTSTWKNLVFLEPVSLQPFGKENSSTQSSVNQEVHQSASALSTAIGGQLSGATLNAKI